MKIQLQLRVGGDTVREETLELAEEKVAELNEDELREAIEINIRDWVDKLIEVSWEITEE